MITERDLVSLFDEQRPYVRSLARRRSVEGHWRLNAEDMEAECFMLMVKLFRNGKYNTDHDTFVKVFRTSANHELGTLIYHETITYRKDTMYAESIEDKHPDEVMVDYHFKPCQEAIPDRGPLPEDCLIAKDQLAVLSSRMSELQKRMVAVFAGEDKKSEEYLRVLAARRSFVFTKPTITIDSFFLSRVLAVSKLVIENETNNLRKLLAEVG